MNPTHNLQYVYLLQSFNTNKEDAYSREKSLKLHAQGLRRLKERLRNTLVL